MVFLVGGPGSQLIEEIANNGTGPMIDHWLRTRDVILFEQRGIGLSQPKLACPQFDTQDNTGLTIEQADAKALESLKA